MGGNVNWKLLSKTTSFKTSITVPFPCPYQRMDHHPWIKDRKISSGLLDPLISYGYLLFH